MRVTESCPIVDHFFVVASYLYVISAQIIIYKVA